MKGAKKVDKRKNIDLPQHTIKVLGYLADKNRMPVKNYIEKVVIEHATKNDPKS